jgi:hypothetical protein
METINKRGAWNKGKLVGHKPPLKPKDIWAIRIYLQNAHAVRDLAMFNLAIDSKLRGCDLVGLRVRDVTHGVGALLAITNIPFGLVAKFRHDSPFFPRCFMQRTQFALPGQNAACPGR